jgi:hypothetical protein
VAGVDDWKVIPTPIDGGCAAKSPPIDGLSLGIAMSRKLERRILFGKTNWNIEADRYEVPIKIDDLPPAVSFMRGKNKALIGPVPDALTDSFPKAQKIGFHFYDQDYTIPVRDLDKVLAKIESCVAEQAAAHPAPEQPK